MGEAWDERINPKHGNSRKAYSPNLKDAIQEAMAGNQVELRQDVKEKGTSDGLGNVRVNLRA